jgi:hypothetical protein
MGVNFILPGDVANRSRSFEAFGFFYVLKQSDNFYSAEFGAGLGHWISLKCA